MKKLNRFFATVLCFALLSTFVPDVGAEETQIISSDSFEIYSISFENNYCSIKGRFFEKAKCVVTAELADKNSVSVSESSTSLSDGKFSLGIPFKLKFDVYRLILSADNGTKTEVILDLSLLEEIYSLGDESGYEITGVSYAYDAVFIKGIHTGTKNGAVTLRIMDEDKLVTVSQAISDENGCFEIEFKTLPGKYKLYLMAEGLQQVMCEYSEPDFANVFVENLGDKDNASKLIQRLESYVNELEELSEKCRDANISTDYEDAYTAIIKEFILYIKNEISLGMYDRFGQYYYTFKPLYEETKETYEMYLSGEKEPKTVSRFKTGDVNFNGITQTAIHESDGVLQEKPTFFVGYGHWETAAEKIPLFSKLGFNITSTEIMMKDVIVPGVFEGWTDYTSKYNPAEFSLDRSNKVSGGFSLKISNPASESEYNNFRMLSQVIKVKPNTTYVFGLKAKGKGIAPVNSNNEAPAWFGVTGLKSTGRYKIENSSDWQEYDAEYTTGANEETLDLTILSAFGTEELYIDDVYVKEKGADLNLVANGDFEDVPQPESDVERAIYNKGWYINYDTLYHLESVLKNAEEHDMLIDMCLCPGFMPEFILKSDSDSQRHKEYFLPFVMENDNMKEAMSLWARLLCDTLVKYDCVHSLCLLNEPEVHTNGICPMEGHSYDDGYYVPIWQNWLKEKYKTISALNMAYNGTTYKSFEEVAMPHNREATPLFYDYRCFNNEILAEYIKWLSEDVKKYHPELKVHTKIMDYYNFAWERFILNGSDYEIMSDYTDLNGCDAFSTYPYTSYNYTKAPLELKMGWYDYMTSIKEAPVWDTESHISNDYPVPEYDDLVPYYTSADVWNGAIHGRGAQIIWLWDLRRGSLPESWSNYPNANAVMRPADVVQVSKIALDLNRLSEEVTALQKQKPEVGLLWSKTSIGYSDTYMKANSDAYKQIIYSGQKVGFVTETKPEDMHKYKLIVIPEATHLPDNVMSELEKYEGEILIQNNNSLEYNEYNKPYDTKRISAIYSRADVTDDIRGKISEMNLSEVVLIDADTGEKCNEIEWTYTKYNNKYLVNILNYNNKDTKKIEVFVGNRKVQSMTELRSDEMVENGILSIEPYKPQLIEFNISTFDIIDEKGNVIKEDIGKLENGIIRYNINNDGTKVYALYKDDVLVDVSIGEETFYVNPKEDGEYRLMATVWDIQKMIPVSMSRNITMEVE